MQDHAQHASTGKLHCMVEAYCKQRATRWIAAVDKLKHLGQPFDSRKLTRRSVIHEEILHARYPHCHEKIITS